MFCLFQSCCTTFEILFPQQGIELRAMSAKASNPNRWNTRELSQKECYFISYFAQEVLFLIIASRTLEKAMATHSSTLAWQIPRTEEPGRLHGVARNRTQLSDFTFPFHFHALEKEMATHSSVLAWRIPGTGEPGGLPSMWLHRVRHD